MKKLETERLILRPFELSDLDDFYEYCSLETVGPNAGWEVHTSKDESKYVLESFMNKDEVLALYHKTTKKVIGSIGLHKRLRGELEAYEIGYVLSTPYEGNGLMTEACRRLLQYIFMELKLNEVYVYHFINNIKSKRVIEKCYFEYIGTLEYETANFGQKKSLAYKLTRDKYIKHMEG